MDSRALCTCMWIFIVLFRAGTIHTQDVTPRIAGGSVRACYLTLPSSLGQMAINSLDSGDPCTHIILDQDEDSKQESGVGLPDDLVAHLKEAKEKNPRLKLLLTTSPRALVRALRMKWRAGASPRSQWMSSILVNLTDLALDGLNVRVGRNPAASEKAQMLTVLKQLKKTLPPGSIIAITLSLDTTQRPGAMQFLKQMAKYSNVIILENTVGHLAGIHKNNPNTTSLSEAISLIKQATADPVVIKVPLYDGLRLQSMYRKLQDSISNLKTRIKVRRSSGSKMGFTRAKNAMWRSFRNKGCKSSASGNKIRDNMNQLLTDHPDIGVALWSLNHDDLTHVCSDSNLHFTHHMFDEMDRYGEEPVKRQSHAILEMTPDGPQLLIMQDPSVDDMAKAGVQAAGRTHSRRNGPRRQHRDGARRYGARRSQEKSAQAIDDESIKGDSPQEAAKELEPNSHAAGQRSAGKHGSEQGKSNYGEQPGGYEHQGKHNHQDTHGEFNQGQEHGNYNQPQQHDKFNQRDHDKFNHPQQHGKFNQRDHGKFNNPDQQGNPSNQHFGRRHHHTHPGISDHMVQFMARPDPHHRRYDQHMMRPGADFPPFYDNFLRGNRSSSMKASVYSFSGTSGLNDGVPVSNHRGELVTMWASDFDPDQKKGGNKGRSRRDTDAVGTPCDFDRPVADPADCRHYLQCNGGKLDRYYCGQNAVFDPEIKSCSSPNSVEKCKGLQTIWRMREEANFNCESEGYYQHPKDCQLFFRCTRYSTHLFRCPDGLGFDSSTATCDSQDSIPKCRNLLRDSPNAVQDPIQTKKLANWRGQMKIREVEVPVFSAHQNTPVDSYAAKSGPKSGEQAGYIPDFEKFAVAWKEGPISIESPWKEGPISSEMPWKEGPISVERSWKEGPPKPDRAWKGMDIRIAENEEELLGKSHESPTKSYDAPELRRIQIWPSKIPPVPSMRSPTPTEPASPSRAPTKTRPVNEKQDAKRAPSNTYKNLDIVHVPNVKEPMERKYGPRETYRQGEEYGSREENYGPQRENYRQAEEYGSREENYGPQRENYRQGEGYGSREDSREEYYKNGPEKASSSSFHFTKPSEPSSLPSGSEWPEHIRDGWLAETGGISIAIARDFRCPSDGYFRDPKSCKRFYHCSHGLPYHVQCTGGLVFNPRNRICDWQKSMPQCLSYGEEQREEGGDYGGDRQVRGRDAKEGRNPDDNRNNTYPHQAHRGGCVPGSVRTHPSSCNIFHVCSAVAVEYQFRCPDHLAFDERSRRCVAMKLVPHCKASQEEDSESGENHILDDPGDSNPDFRCPTTYGFYRDSENCSRFYECAFWIPFRLSCPIGSLFSAEHRRCEHSDRVVECLPGGAAWKVAMEIYNSKQLVLQQAGISTAQNDILLFQCTQNGRFAEPSDCQIFHECDAAGNHAEYRCPNNMAFNSAISLCDLRHNVPQCQQQMQPPPQQHTRSRYEVQKSLPESAPQPSMQSNNFEIAWSVDGGNSAPVRIEVTSTNDRPLISPRVPTHLAGKIQLKQTGLACQGDSVFHNPSDCRQFFWCYNDMLVMNTCPEPLVFNTDSYQCDLLEYVPRCNHSPQSSVAPSTNPYNPAPSPTPSNPPPPRTPAPTLRRHEPKVYKDLDQQVWKSGPGQQYGNSVDSYYSLDEGEKANKQTLYENASQGEPAAPDDFQCPGDGFYRDQYNCTQFYYCKDGWRYKYACADGRAFDEARSFCNWAAYVPGCS